MSPGKYHKRLKSLIERFQNNKATAEEAAFVEKYYAYFESKQGISDLLSKEEQLVWKEILKMKVKKGISQAGEPKINPFYRNLYLRAASVAAILMIMAVGTYLLLIHKTEVPQNITYGVVSNDVLPGTTKATLTLADGSVITLDNKQNGLLAQQGNAAVVKKNDQLVYDVSKALSSNVSQPALSNTLSTPRGGQYVLTLPDGTRVWLNAASSIRFPAFFSGKERRVEITGEAYFEVAPLFSSLQGASKSGRGVSAKSRIPFIVSVNGTEVRVLGTHFNVNAYKDEEAMKVTLLEGSVSVLNLKTNDSRLIIPGEQASVNTRGTMNVLEVNPDEVVAWKNGLFFYHNADLAMLLREISRWYNIEVEIKGELPKRTFFLEGTRSLKLSELLRGFEVNHIPYRIDGENHKLTVNP